MDGHRPAHNSRCAGIHGARGRVGHRGCGDRCTRVGRDDLDPAELEAVTDAHPRPDFKRRILEAFTNGFKDRPDTTFGTVNADVLAHFVPGFKRIDFVEVIQNNTWPE